MLVGSEKVELLLIYIIYTLEPCSLSDGPREGAYADLQLLFKLVEEVKGVFALTVHLVDEDYHRSFPHTAHRHQFPRLGLHTLSTVNDNDYAVHCSERAEGIFGKVLVSGGVKYVYLVGECSICRIFWQIVEFHHRSGYGDSTLFLYFHPVGGGGFPYLVALHCPCYLDLTAEKQKFFRKGGLSGIGVRNDGKGASTCYFCMHIGMFFWLGFLVREIIFGVAFPFFF